MAPSFITEPSKRIIDHGTFYERPAPFSFILGNKDLTAFQQDDFLVTVSVEGNEIPESVTIILNGNNYRMKKIDNTHYSYLIKNINHSQDFQFQAVGVLSRPYTIDVIPRPAVLNFQVRLSYPAYTGLESESLMNVGDITVPKGTQIEWSFQTKDADSLFFINNDLTKALFLKNNGRVKTGVRAMQSFSYSFFANNTKIVSDTLSYSVSVVETVDRK